MQDTNKRGLYLRNGVWWMRACVNGRKIRKSTRSMNMNDAIIFRDEVLSSLGRSYVNDEWRQYIHSQLRDSSSWLRRTHSRIRRRSKSRKWLHCLTQTELLNLMLQSKGKCAITGIDFFRAPTTERHPFAISIDRINSKEGYQLNNCRLVLLAVNLGMCQWGDDAFMEICRSATAMELLSARAKRAQ